MNSYATATRYGHLTPPHIPLQAYVGVTREAYSRERFRASRTMCGTRVPRDAEGHDKHSRCRRR